MSTERSVPAPPGAKDDAAGQCGLGPLQQHKGVTMARPDGEADVLENRHVVLVLRLTLDQRSQLLYGEVLNAEGIGLGRFMNLAKLNETVNRWLERQQDDQVPGTTST